LISLFNILQATKLDVKALNSFEKSHPLIDFSLNEFLCIELPEFSQTKLFQIVCDYLLERIKSKKVNELDIFIIFRSFTALLDISIDNSKPEMIIFELIQLNRLNISLIH
jgi:hypothetical protein